MKDTLNKKEAIKSIVSASVRSFAAGFEGRHVGELKNPNGTLNMKIHNIFIAVLSPELRYYTALVRSLDSSLGNMLEKMAIGIAELSYEVKQQVEGPLSLRQTQDMAVLLEKYKRREISPPQLTDYQLLRIKPTEILTTKRHESDYCLIDKQTGDYSLIELKIGGDLDNKKSRSEKEALMEQLAILSNTLPTETKVNIYFATAYNRFGEGKPWKQERVRQYFADKELLIGKDFWNFICKSEDGYETVLDAYKEKSSLIKDSLDSIKKTYLG